MIGRRVESRKEEMGGGGWEEMEGWRGAKLGLGDGKAGEARVRVGVRMSESEGEDEAVMGKEANQHLIRL